MTARIQAKELVLYGAGSLREAMAQIGTSFGQAHGATVSLQFGASCRMRERTESTAMLVTPSPARNLLSAATGRMLFANLDDTIEASRGGAEYFEHDVNAGSMIHSTH